MKMKGEATDTKPTIGFNVERINVDKKLEFIVWDVAGQDKLRVFWRNYYHGTCGVIFVVDSNDRDRFPMAKEALHSILHEEELEAASVLVFANKQDMEQAASLEELRQALDMDTLAKKRTTHIIPTIAVTGKGFDEGFAWLSENVNPV
jgi:ADP-ribosylation factor 1/2